MLHVTASPSGEVIGTIANQTIVQHYATFAGWAYVEADEQQGYIKASEMADLKILDNKVYNKGVTVAKGAKKTGGINI